MQIEARAGQPGALYQTKSGHRVRVLRLEAEQVILEPDGQPGKEIPVPSHYLLFPAVEAPVQPAPVGPDGQPSMDVSVEELVMQPRNVIEPAIKRLSTPDLERLSELDTRMFVLDLVAKELQARAERAGQVAPLPEPLQGVSIGATVATAHDEAAPVKPRRVWIMLLEDFMLVEVPGRSPLRLAYEGDDAPTSFLETEAIVTSTDNDDVRVLSNALRERLGEDGIEPSIWELGSTMAQAIQEARLAVVEGGTPRGLTSSRDQAALVKEVSSLTGLAWMARGAVQATTRREIERQVKALEGLVECATVSALEKWAEDKRAKPLERPGVARRYAQVRRHLEAIEAAVPALAWCQENGFSFELDGVEQDPGLWLDGLGEETPERIQAAGAAALAVRARQLADREERTDVPPSLIRGIEQAEQGEISQVGSFAQYADDDDEEAAAPTPAPVNLAEASLADQLAICSAARALELLAGADYERDRSAICQGWGRTTNLRVKEVLQAWMDEHRPVEIPPAPASSAPPSVSPPIREEPDLAARQRAAAAAVQAKQQEAANVMASAVQAAQQTLAALAIGLPALAQLGLEVDIRITTRRADSAKS